MSFLAAAFVLLVEAGSSLPPGAGYVTNSPPPSLAIARPGAVIAGPVATTSRPWPGGGRVVLPSRLWTRFEADDADEPRSSWAESTTVRVIPPVGAGDEPIEFEPLVVVESEGWLRAPFGDNLLVDPGQWRSDRASRQISDAIVDYNRVDQLRVGTLVQLQDPFSMAPRFGGRIEYATGRKRTLYGVQLEQPLLPPGRLAIGASMVRRTDHSELQQVDDLENTLALLFGRQDYRDYFEREGAGVYLSWRVPDFSTVSVHARSDDYRSLGVNRATRSWFQRDRALRENPPIDEGTEHAMLVRLERLAQTTRRMRAGLYHWIEVERAGDRLGGEFEFTRALADLRSVFRLSPATTLSIRGVGGHTARGTLPRQRQFTVGGVDGLRAHSFSQYRGDQMVLGQAEYDIGLWRPGRRGDVGGCHVLTFVDVGRAWSNADHAWDVGDQRIQADGGVGLASADNALRVYFAKNLQKPESDFVISMRLQRPF